MVSAFNNKFFCAEAKYTLTELGSTRQYPGEDHDLYIKRFHEKILDCRDLIDEEVLVNVFLHDMDNEYQILLESI